MAPITPTTRTYPKRKRAKICYRDSSSDEIEADEEYTIPNQSLSRGTTKKLGTTSSTEPLPVSKIFPFTSLPGEIKNQIYELALICPVGIRLTYEIGTHRPFFRAISPLMPKILLLNKAIHAEAQSILYASNKFALEDARDMATFLTMIGPKNRATLKDITLQYWGYLFWDRPLNMLADAVNLTNVTLDCKVRRDSPIEIARDLYRDRFGWLEAIGAAKGSLDAGIGVITIDDSSATSNWAHNLELSYEENIQIFRAELRRMNKQGA